MSLAPILNGGHLALVIGNGINRYEAAPDANSWEALLGQLAQTHMPDASPSIPKDVSLTEFYDVLEMKAKTNGSLAAPLQQSFCDLMQSWRPGPHHEAIVGWAKVNSTPILTTNFERVLADAGGCTLMRARKGGFTDYYPWESYYADLNCRNPAEDFAIWHVNGMERYRRSIRLGLTHYMGSVERARSWIHKGNERRLFSGKNIDRWKGATSWLHVIVKTPLLVLGLGLDEREVFLRWLFLVRARYFQKFPERAQKAWYVYVGDSLSDGKRFFLDGVGIQPIQVQSYDEVYSPRVWQ